MIVAGAVLAAAGCAPRADQARVVVGTTASAAGTGLPQSLVHRFGDESHQRIDLVIDGHASLISRVRDGGIDAAIVEASLLPKIRAARHVQLQNTFAYDDYLLVGPKRDPHVLAPQRDLAGAMRRIAEKNASFCSAVDVPDLHAAEAEVWSEAHIDPHSLRRNRPCKGDAAGVLAEAERRGAYTLTDRATFEGSPAGRKMKIVAPASPVLQNALTVVLFADPMRNRNATWFVQWVMSYRGRELVDSYRYDNGRRFFGTR